MTAARRLGPHAGRLRRSGAGRSVGRRIAHTRLERPASGECGQATVELAALLPLVVVVALAAYGALAGLAAVEQAGVAAEAGAIAFLQDRDPAAAARSALPEELRRSAAVSVGDRRVTVRVRPRVPLVARLLPARVTAHAGPEPAP